jgi:hypothetical protein
VANSQSVTVRAFMTARLAISLARYGRTAAITVTDCYDIIGLPRIAELDPVGLDLDVPPVTCTVLPYARPFPLLTTILLYRIA